MILYIGCYTTPENPNGLRVVDFNCATGKMTPVASYAVDNPLYLAKTADGRFLYANEADGLGSFAIGADGRLTRVDAVRYGAKAMCHVALAPGDECLTWAAYTSGEAGCEHVKDGRFLGGERHTHTGHGPDPRQASAHCHEAVPTPDGKHYVVVDLGLDALVTYPLPQTIKQSSYPQSNNQTIKQSPTSPLGAGPRHVLFHPDGRHAFVVFEIGSRIASYDWSVTDGFRMLDSLPTMPSEWKGLNWDAAIRFTPDARRIVVSNRGYDALTVFDFDIATGKLALVARSVLPGCWPRDFVFVPGTDFAVVTMERSGTVLTVRYDAQTGGFSPVDALDGLHRPVAVVF